jgi:hypothetical protein
MIENLFNQIGNSRILNKVKGELIKRYPDENSITSFHLPVHAVHKHIYEKIRGEKRYQMEIRTIKERIADKKSRAKYYLRAWDIVNDIGHNEILGMIKESAENTG